MIGVRKTVRDQLISDAAEECEPYRYKINYPEDLYDHIYRNMCDQVLMDINFRIWRKKKDEIPGE